MRQKRGNLAAAGADPKAAAALKQLSDAMLDDMDDASHYCVGRIDLDSDESYHIGPRVIWEATEPIVISWAAPVAAPFYEAGPTDPQGLRLRRRLRTDLATLLGISDEWFGLASAPEPTLDDSLLEELGRDRTGEMREIVATIQRDQYRIITRPAESATVVQGGPGTGKTVVGLHRAALLLFRNRNITPAPRILIVGPNPLFMQYIAYVLPSLGESAVDQLAIQQLGSLSSVGAEEPLVGRIKGDRRMSDVLPRALADRVSPPDEDVQFEAGGRRFSVAAELLGALVKDFDPKKENYRPARDRFRSSFERLAADAYTAVRQRGDEQVRVSSLPEFDRALDRIWPSLSAEEVVRQLLSSQERLEKACSGVFTTAETSLLYRRPVERLGDVVWTEDDGPLVDEMRYLIDGPTGSYWHVVLDEAQDLTPMELRMVGRRIRTGAVTILGDLAQATGAWSYDSWDEVMGHIGIAEATTIEEMRHAYRVPGPIMDAALPILQLTAPSTAPPISYRGGESPSWQQVSQPTRAQDAVTAAKAAQERGGTVAIISPGSLMEGIRTRLMEDHVAFGDADQGQLALSIELLDPARAKGLEFDRVVLVEPAVLIREHPDGRGYRELYVALTRATRSLACVHAEALPWPLGSAPGDRALPGGILPGLGQSPAPGPAEQTADRPTVRLTLGEAIVLGSVRGLSPGDALARALIALAGGASEEEAAAAVLAEGDDKAVAVAQLVERARELASPADD